MAEKAHDIEDARAVLEEVGREAMAKRVHVSGAVAERRVGDPMEITLDRVDGNSPRRVGAEEDVRDGMIDLKVRTEEGGGFVREQGISVFAVLAGAHENALSLEIDVGKREVVHSVRMARKASDR